MNDSNARRARGRDFRVSKRMGLKYDGGRKSYAVGVEGVIVFCITAQKE